MSMETGLAREVGAVPAGAATSVDARLQVAYQRAHTVELHRLIADLPLYPGDRVLDLACGEGVYTLPLAAKVAPGGEVIGVDTDSSQLEQARIHANKSGWGRSIAFHRVDLQGLPFSDNRFDLVWCAQPLDTLPDVYTTLRELRRVLRPGGRIALFEQGILDDLVLPWPDQLAIAIDQAQARAVGEQSKRDEERGEFDLCSVLLDIGFANCVVTPYTITRRAPLPASERSFFADYFETIASHLAQQIDADHQDLIDELFDPRAKTYLLDQQDFAIRYTINVTSARKG